MSRSLPASMTTAIPTISEAILVKEEEICSPTTTGPENITIATYLYDETNQAWCPGTNRDRGGTAHYTFNGLGVRVGAELILQRQQPRVHGLPLPDAQRGGRHLEGPQGPEVVLSDYVIDYTRLGHRPAGAGEV